MIIDQPLHHGSTTSRETVVLLHGLARSSGSMGRMEQALQQQGFGTCNVDYPSTQSPIAELAQRHVLPAIRECAGDDFQRLHFVTHSMGGIIVRYLARHSLLSSIGRVVMLGPPNKGSEVVDTLGDTWFFEFANGPAGKELGTDSASLPAQLGAADFEVGILTGSRSINPVLSLMIDGTDDGKVSTESAKLEGMQDYLVLPATHTFIMRNDDAIRQTIHFLHHGFFNRAEMG